VFKAHKERKAAEAQASALAAWQSERDGYAALVETARNYQGETSSALLLHAGEVQFASVTNCALVEERKGPGTWQGQSHGVSIPVVAGVRYRVGATKGHFVAGEQHPSAIDHGEMVITNVRVCFLGSSQTRECDFAKLLGFSHGEGFTTFSVSNRQKPTTVYYGPKAAEWVHFRLDLALAHFRGDVADFVGAMEAQLATLDAGRPTSPAAP